MRVFGLLVVAFSVFVLGVLYGADHYASWNTMNDSRPALYVGFGASAVAVIYGCIFNLKRRG